jgi:hypothetical protein
MINRTQYIPANAKDFNEFFKKIVLQVGLKTSGTAPAWKHIPKENLDALNTAYSAWYTAFSASLGERSPSKTHARREAQKTAVSFLRGFVNRFLRYLPVTDEERIEMEIPVRDTIKTPSGIPKEKVGFTLKALDDREIAVSFKVKGAAGRAKPRGYHGAVIAYAVLDKPPLRYEELTRQITATRTPCILEFDREEEGKRAYVALRWKNGTGKNGVWSEIQQKNIA